MKKIFNLKLFVIICCLSLFNSCTEEKAENGRITTDEQYHANIFAGTSLETFYYWNKDISNDLLRLNPETNTDPITTVNEIRYHEGDTEIDRWTMLTDDFESFNSSLEGVYTTYGYQPITYLLDESTGQCVSAVAYVYQNSPAEKAGLKRGDIIYEIDGKPLTVNNYTDLFYSSQITLSLAAYDATINTIVPTEQTVTMQAVEMYENPILCYKTIDLDNGNKIGYLAYSSFDLNSIPELIEISKDFKAKGVKKLVLDLRYNGGGYVITENVLASMFAPQDVVDSKAIFEKEDYNELLTASGWSSVTRFTTTFNYESVGLNVSTEGANIGLEHIYALIGPNTASASEALIGGLMPYMPITLIGEQSHGKYCTGIPLSSKELYDMMEEVTPTAIKNWGIYVMIGIYMNSKNETPCMPNGLIPDIEAIDDPMQPVQLGDENEILLRAALEKEGKQYPETSSLSRSMLPWKKLKGQPHKTNFGKRILLPAADRPITFKK
ncbi:S41 family peptidase [Phocaeicola barnesiae]|uniref:S41 family peptidase n=1 Tax=Phocaeicola barnesiae TaxID=376804 RepID=UPI00241E2790|nr:S41 family peptidase [Phocaeicola barnesiae]